MSNDQANNDQVSSTPPGIEATGQAPSWFEANRTPVIVAIAIAVVAVVAIVSIKLGSSSSSKSGGSNATVVTPAKDSTQVNLSADGLKTAVKALGKTVYWAGDEAGDTYVLQTFADGRVWVRYVPKDGDPNASGAIYRLMGSYPIKNAFSVTKSAASGDGAVLVTNADGSVVLYNKSKMTNAYIAFPKIDVQVEIFDPTPGKALALATSGAIVPIA